eukprot:GFUD01058121.1.p1 GENE.GFUD01058121.1~~GFUD01058121.1.p1  ORF type:complete len:272 (-),score=52.16 GFUD01058121.1:161-976(-)
MACSYNGNMPPGPLPCVVSHYIMVMFVQANVACVLSCMKNTVTSITPVVEVGVNSIKAMMKEFGINSLSEELRKKIESNVNTAVFNVAAAVEKISSISHSQLAVASKIHYLRTSTIGLFLGTVQDKTTSFGVSTIMASLSSAQVVLKVADAGLHVFGQTLWITGVSDRAWRRVRRFHITTSTIPLWSTIMARTESARKKKEAFTLGIVVKVLKEFLLLMLLKMIQLFALIMWMMELWWRWLVLRRIEIAVTCQFALNAGLLLEKFVLVQHK